MLSCLWDDLLLLIQKNSQHSGGSRFPLLLSGPLQYGQYHIIIYSKNLFLSNICVLYCIIK